MRWFILAIIFLFGCGQPHPIHKVVLHGQCYDDYLAGVEKGDFSVPDVCETWDEREVRIKKERESRECYFVATFERGEAAYLSGQYDAAIADFTGLLERFPKVSGSYYYRGASLSNLGRHEED